MQIFRLNFSYVLQANDVSVTDVDKIDVILVSGLVLRPTLINFFFSVTDASVKSASAFPIS
jgi:hypothetical protein